ncbi:MAG: hypothetical protein ACJ77A_05305 [Actinomycetota bacterium]
MSKVSSRRFLVPALLLVACSSLLLAVWSWQHMTKSQCMTRICDPVVSSGPGSPLFTVAIGSISLAAVPTLTARQLRRRRNADDASSTTE